MSVLNSGYILFIPLSAKGVKFFLTHSIYAKEWPRVSIF